MLGLFIICPVFGERSIPQMLKLVLALWLAFIFSMVIHFPIVPKLTSVEIIVQLVTQLYIGFVIGFIARMIFSGIAMAGSLMDMQMGLSSASIFDPANGAQVTIMERIMINLSIFIFLVTDSHVILLSALHRSFDVIPLFREPHFQTLLGQVAHMGAGLFMSALNLSMPLLAIIFMLDFSLGLLSRLSPQVNVFSLGFQIKPLLGLWIFIFIVPIYQSEMVDKFNDILIQIYKVFEGVRLS